MHLSTNKKASLQTALVVGASSGVGLACVRALSASGVANVYASSRTVPETAEIPHKYIPVDVTQDNSVKALVDQVLSESTKIDLLIYSAGYVLSGPIEDTTLSEAQRQFDTNFWGMVRVVQAVLPSMRQAGGGTIVLIGSVAGLIPLPFQGYYSASKFAMEAYCEALSFEVEPFGIRLCLIQPGDLNTPFTSKRQRTAACNADSIYAERFNRCMQEMEKFEAAGQAPEKVASAILNLVNRNHLPLRYRVSKPFEELVLVLKNYCPNFVYRRVIKSAIGD